MPQTKHPDFFLYTGPLEVRGTRVSAEGGGDYARSPRVAEKDDDDRG